jgi:hypothetical protein
VFPSTACLLQAKLGVAGCPAFDVQAVCSGFVYGLAVADNFIRAGQARCALVVGTEVFSRILDWSDRATCVLFGDGAGAVVLRAAERPGVHGCVLHADGRQAGILEVPGNVCGGKVAGSAFVRMDGPAVFKFAVRVLDESARELVAKCRMQLADVDWLIPHQANVRILDATVKRLGLPHERLIVTVDRHANTRPRRYRSRSISRCATAASGRATRSCSKASGAASPGARRWSSSEGRDDEVWNGLPGSGVAVERHARGLWRRTRGARGARSRLRDAQAGHGQATDGPADELNKTVNTQPVMLTAGYAAYRLWRALGGPEPAVLAGHSLGEYTALVAAGALAFEDALPLVRLRGQAMQEAVPEGQGAMAAVLGLDDDEIRAACAESAQGEIVGR